MCRIVVRELSYNSNNNKSMKVYYTNKVYVVAIGCGLGKFSFKLLLPAEYTFVSYTSIV